MIIASNILLLSGLSVAFWQDLKFRAIHWLVFALVFLISVSTVYFNEGISWRSMFMNMFFSTLVVVLLFLFLSLKNRVWTNAFKAHMGLGDYLFFLAVSPLFGQENFILFFISGMFFAAIIQPLLLFFLNRYENRTIPLAGLLSLYILLLKGLEYFSNWNPFTDSILL